MRVCGRFRGAIRKVRFFPNPSRLCLPPGLSRGSARSLPWADQFTSYCAAPPSGQTTHPGHAPPVGSASGHPRRNRHMKTAGGAGSRARAAGERGYDGGERTGLVQTQRRRGREATQAAPGRAHEEEAAVIDGPKPQNDATAAPRPTRPRRATWIGSCARSTRRWASQPSSRCAAGRRSARVAGGPGRRCSIRRPIAHASVRQLRSSPELRDMVSQVDGTWERYARYWTERARTTSRRGSSMLLEPRRRQLTEAAFDLNAAALRERPTHQEGPDWGLS